MAGVHSPIVARRDVISDLFMAVTIHLIRIDGVARPGTEPGASKVACRGSCRDPDEELGRAIGSN